MRSSPVGRNGALARSSSDSVMLENLIEASDELCGLVEALKTVEIGGFGQVTRPKGSAPGRSRTLRPTHRLAL
jgi:hypothetical protein